MESNRRDDAASETSSMSSDSVGRNPHAVVMVSCHTFFSSMADFTCEVVFLRLEVNGLFLIGSLLVCFIQLTIHSVSFAGSFCNNRFAFEWCLD